MNPCFSHQTGKPSGKKATKHPVEQFVEKQRIRHTSCRETPPPLSNEFVRLHRGYKFLWISALLPVLWARVLRFNWVRAKDPCLKAHQNSTTVYNFSKLPMFSILHTVVTRASPPCSSTPFSQLVANVIVTSLRSITISPRLSLIHLFTKRPFLGILVQYIKQKIR